MCSSSYSDSRPGSRYYPVSSSSGYLGSRFDDETSEQMEYRSSRHGRRERSHRVRNQSSDGRRSTDASRARRGASRHSTHVSGYGSSYVSSRSRGNSARIGDGAHYQDYSRVADFSRSRAPSRASTIYPDDSVSNTGRRPHHQRDAEVRGRSVAPAGHYSHRIFEGYSPTLSPFTSSRQHSHSSRNFDSGPTYRYVPPTRSEMSAGGASNVSSSSVTHPFAYDSSGRTHTWHPPPHHLFPDSSHRSRRSAAPSPEPRASYGQAGAGAYRSMASSRTRLPRGSGYGSSPSPTPVLRGRSGGNFSFISSAMEDAAYDSDVEHPFS